MYFMVYTVLKGRKFLLMHEPLNFAERPIKAAPICTNVGQARPT